AIGRLLPPASRADHVEPAVAVDIADAEPVRELHRAGDRLAGGKRLADRVLNPRFGRIGIGREPGHLALVAARLFFGLPAHDEHAVTSAEQIDILRRLIAGTVPDLMLCPETVATFGVLVPVGGLAGKSDHDQVRPAVA